MRYRLVVKPGAQRGLDKLPPKVQHAVASFITGPLLDNPKRVGKALGGELIGSWSARRGEYRVIYDVDDDVITVTVIRIAPRGSAYR